MDQGFDTAPGFDTGLDPVPRTGCVITTHFVTCPYQTLELLGWRVHYSVPQGTPPAWGWPVALLFQGSFFSGETFFEGHVDDPFGGLHQARVTAELLAAGFVVVAPEAQGDGNLFWDTNIPPWSLAWSGSPDDQLVRAIFDTLDRDELGRFDSDRLFAAGISSGGYMASRMAVAYPERFAAVFIHSASYATCSGPVCFVPALSPAHPPTAFLHGILDLIVPLYTTVPYRDKLAAQGTPISVSENWTGGHAWFNESPSAIVSWFLQHQG